MTLFEIAEALSSVTFGILAAVSLGRWIRRRGSPDAWAAITFGALGSVVIVSAIVGEEEISSWLQKIELAAIALFPYGLYRFSAWFCAPARRFLKPALVLTAGVIAFGMFIPSLDPEMKDLPPIATAFLIAFMLQWVALSVISVVSLWRESKRQVAIARRRMRWMSIGALGLVIALVQSAGTGSEQASEAAQAIGQVLALASALAFAMGFMPPPVVRVWWRRLEAEELRRAVVGLIEATSLEAIASSLLPRVAEVTAARLVSFRTEDMVATFDPEVGDVEFAEPESKESEYVERVDIVMTGGTFSIWVDNSLTFFGDEEIALLESIRGLVDLAVERTRLAESDNARRKDLETLNDELQLARSFLDQVVENIPSMLVVRDASDLTLLRVNRAAEGMLGSTREELVGNTYARTLNGSAPPSCERDGDVLAGRRPIEIYRERFEANEEEPRYLHTRKIPIMDEDGDVAYLLDISDDITERVAAEEQALRAREEAEKANKAKSEFLSRMSHELRTPLNAILGFGQLLEMDETEPDRKDNLQHILRAGRHLLDLINEILDISRIEAGRLSLSIEPVAVRDVIDETLSLVQPIAGERGISIVDDAAVDAELYVRADRQRLKQILINLVSNAIKYNRANGTVTVTVASEGDNLRLSVADTGFGISEESAARIFTPFERLGAESSSIEGTGLGLALSHALAGAMGGDLEFSSVEGKGSTFWIDLPPAGTEVSANGFEDLEDEDELADESRLMKIVYVEDNLANLRLVERVLKRRPGIELLPAMQGKVGLDLVAAHDADLILVDLHLPDIPGEDVVRALRLDERFRAMPIVVISADATPGQIERLMEVGADDYMTKPIDVHRLLEVIDRYVLEVEPTGA